ncbi:hypothetical protein FHX37_0644 [Haloactinospora alba]|uniref:Excreted virulence factor EspC (Type VII ESX diderm) n=1 Tax=Haloactinospora alba TaxID=405555 RepID=A0A543NG62_9ACTN|nr:hypothetical protein [Haloactinospora alba]TQN30760.1 hypothetical protein FHX37_0644 [Haloactinospora alba]
MTDEAGGNPDEIRGEAANAAELANAMTGLRETFTDIMDGVRKAAVEEECAEGYSKFKEKYLDDITDVENHGMELARNLDAGGAEIGATDDDTSDSYESPWPGLSRPVNGPSGTPTPANGRTVY